MKYISTRQSTTDFSASNAIHQGLANDGGLLVPKNWPKIEWNDSWKNLNFPNFAYQVLIPFFKGDNLESHLKDICDKAFDFPLPIVDLKNNTSVLELFHGPTCAFKDFGARFLALCCQHIPQYRNEKQAMVLVATSGDTGGAVASAFTQLTSINVTILFPKYKVSKRQEAQLCCWGNQVKSFRVNGTFDDCQRMAKEIFLNQEWHKKFNLISANSINLARILPQMAYFAFASLQSKEKANFIIPSGNMGNAAAAIWARQLGFPINKIIFSHNSNSTVVDYFNSGKWSPKPSIETLANAMDVGNPSNFERIRNLIPDLNDLKAFAAAYCVSDSDIKKTISSLANIGYLACPHTATAFYIRNHFASLNENWIIAATAHPSKFESIVEPLIGRSIAIPLALESILTTNPVFKDIEPNILSLEYGLNEPHYS